MDTQPASDSKAPVSEEWIDLSGDGGVLKKVRWSSLGRKDCTKNVILVLFVLLYPVYLAI